MEWDLCAFDLDHAAALGDNAPVEPDHDSENKKVNIVPLDTHPEIVIDKAGIEPLLANGHSKLLELVADPSNGALVDKLCSESPKIKAAVFSEETFIAMAKPSTASIAVKLVEKGFNATPQLIAKLAEGRAPVTPTTALKFAGDIYLEDDGSDMPLGNTGYTVEIWCRLSEKGCLFSYGAGHGRNRVCGAHFEGHGFNHFWYVRRRGTPGEGLLNLMKLMRLLQVGKRHPPAR